MNILRYDRLTALLAKVRRKNRKLGKTLESRLSVFREAVDKAAWKTPVDVKKQFGSADNIGGNRMVFDLCGNTYRVVAKINYAAGLVEIRFAGTHEEYDAIDATSI